MLIRFFTEEIPMASNPETCQIPPCSLFNADQLLAQNSPTNTQTLMPPIPAAPGVVWPATRLSGNSGTKQHLPFIMTTMAANPEVEVLSTNPPSAFTPVKNSLKTNQIELSSFTPSDRSFKTVLIKHSIIHSNVPTRSKSVSSVGRQVKYLSLLLDGYYILCLLIVIPGVVRNPPKKKLPESQVGVR